MNNKMKVEVIDNVLTISIGIKELANAFLLSPWNWDAEKDKELFSVADNQEFADEVVRELLWEEDDGTTLVHLMFDTAMERAVENGSEGISP